MFRAAAVQLTVGDDEAANREKCLRFLDEAVRGGAELVVFPEFCHLPSRLASGAQAHPLAVTDGHPFLAAMRGGARRHGVWVAVNAFEQGPFPQVLDTTYLLGPDGAIAGRYHKHLLFGPERNWLTPGRDGYPVFATPLARLGLFTCMDGLIPEPARCLAAGGAEVLVDCLNSGGPDEPALHIPVRALENGVWIVAANKVGPVAHGAAARYVGGSAVVRPDGSLAARADEDGETVILADIDPSLADRSRLAGRRPEAYAALYRPPAGRVRVAAPEGAPGAGLVAGAPEPVPGAWSVVAADGGVAVFDPGGACRGRYRPVHPGPGDAFTVVHTPFGDLGLSSGEDLWHPEAARCLALSGADLLVHLGPWHDLLLVERAAENRMAALAVGPDRCGLVRLGPLQTLPHWRARQPELETAARIDAEVDLSFARVKGDQLAGRCAEDCEVLGRRPA